MTRSMVVIAFVLSCLGGSCDNIPPKPQPTPHALPDGGVAADVCEASCANQQRLQCPGASGKNTPSGKTCVEVCRTQDGTFNLESACVADASDCSAVFACFRNSR